MTHLLTFKRRLGFSSLPFHCVDHHSWQHVGPERVPSLDPRMARILNTHALAARRRCSKEARHIFAKCGRLPFQPH